MKNRVEELEGEIRILKQNDALTHAIRESSEAGYSVFTTGEAGIEAEVINQAIAVRRQELMTL